MSEAQSPPGYDIPAVEAWIADNVAGLTPPLKWTLLPGGHSNLTCSLEDSAGRKAVIRRPPMGELLPKAHDMAREWAVISALGPTPVPVPGCSRLLRGYLGHRLVVLRHGIHRWSSAVHRRRHQPMGS